MDVNICCPILSLPNQSLHPKPNFIFSIYSNMSFFEYSFLSIYILYRFTTRPRPGQEQDEASTN